MNAQITQIAERLRGLRDALNLTVVQAAEKCGVSEDNYALYESGTSDIPMSFICEVAQTFGVETSALFSGDDAHSLAYFVTRKGTGTSVERTKCYKYQSLAHGFRNAKVEPFEVTVEPCQKTIHLNTHSGQEFNLVLEGVLQLRIADNDIVLNEGDSIYFDATKPHGMTALNGRNARFLAVII
ncbi:MAG: helix-turn-helix transcriptional regulator [Paludibacter sp.]|jgi:transcriptional regulator with XRE-family HTH domain|nr:helix-turn-helix transcriptional regulator [Paludibacter sp.]